MTTALLVAWSTASLIGLRSGLLLLGLMALLAWARAPKAATVIERHRSACWGALAGSVVLFGIRYLTELLRLPLPLLAGRLVEIVAVMCGCAALILMLAVRALQRGLSLSRVRRSIMTNVGIVSGFVVVAWVFHR